MNRENLIHLLPQLLHPSILYGTDSLADIAIGCPEAGSRARSIAVIANEAPALTIFRQQKQFHRRRSASDSSSVLSVSRSQLKTSQFVVHGNATKRTPRTTESWVVMLIFNRISFPPLTAHFLAVTLRCKWQWRTESDSVSTSSSSPSASHPGGTAFR